MKKNPLAIFRNVPITSDIIQSCYNNLSAPDEKVRALEKDEQIIRLKRGLYVVTKEVSGINIDICLCANHIYGPSYVSLQWALRWYGLIPEQVFTVTSITTKRSRTFKNKLGNFDYKQVNKNYYPIGIKIIEENGVCSQIATPEKALCDTIIYDSYVPSNSISGLYRYLEEDMRFDIDVLPDFNCQIIEQCAANGIKQNIFNNLLKIIKR